MSSNLGGFISATFNPLSGAPTTVEYLVVAGGGGGGGANGGYFSAGGGGAGGLLTASNFAVTAGSALTITVGAGGAGSSTIVSSDASGQNSVFSSITAISTASKVPKARATSSRISPLIVPLNNL